jgi:hypothetical protein
MTALARVLAVLVCALLPACAVAQRAPASQQPEPPFVFAALGDTPYSPDEEARFVWLLAELNRAGLAFVVHVGDF